jgi:glycosyltransferase involved in cell wall biosynthesis
MRVLALTRYTSLGPSSRVRFYQYASPLASLGMEVDVAPLLGEDYVHNLYNGKPQSPLSVFKAYMSRITSMVKCRPYDLLWIEKELLPWLPVWTERILVKHSIPTVVDYDDAVFHRYDLHDDPLVRAFLGRRIDTIMHQATTVVVGNDYLAGRAHQAGARKVEYLPSVVDTTRYSVREKSAGEFRIGWIGSPITVPYLGLIKEPLEEALKQTGARLVLIGAGDQDPLPGIEKEILPWSEETEVSLIQSFDVGIMPLSDGPFEQGKCGYKLVQYMACGLPVVASPVGVNTRIVEHGKTGFLASNSEEWLTALVTLFQDASLRKFFGTVGRRKVEKEYCLKVTAPRLYKILTEAASRSVSLPKKASL